MKTLMPGYLSITDVETFYIDEGGHGLDHVLRVHRAAMWIAREVDADLEIVNTAALLHDIARNRESRGECRCHAEEGARMAQQILISVGYTQDGIDSICHCIAVHRFSKGREASSLEAKVIQDADRLDALGAICVARIFMYNGLHRLPMHEEHRRPLVEYNGEHTTAVNHFYEKILKIRPESFHTEPARHVARRRYGFIEAFLEQFHSEWSGRDLVLTRTGGQEDGV
jgi:uncharacterized protein